MKLPISWLKEYINVSVSPEKLAELYTMSGTAVEKVETKDHEAVLDIEVTTNRPDCLSVLGLAREFSALKCSKVRFPKLKPAKKVDAVKIEILDKKGCPFYTARLIEGVSIKEAPASARRSIELSGARPLNNVVDATNFVLFEMGQPLHAFDADKIKGHIVVRRAKKDEKFLGIDGNEYVLDDKTLVIADSERALALAGVMGGRFTEITSQTKNVLLESAYFDPALVRQAAKRYKISTESSYRFERGVDIENVEAASLRARDLIAEWAGGTASGRGQSGSSTVHKKNIVLRLSRLEAVLGMKVTASRASTILKNLGFNVKTSGKDKLSVASWNARRDVVQEADLIEEILRIEGFEKIPTVIPITRHTRVTADPKAAVISELKKFCAALGFTEIVSYSLLSQKALEESGHDLAAFKPHRVMNAPSAEQGYFRPHLFTGALEAVAFNLHRKATGVKFFEIGNVCVEGREETMLALTLCGAFEQNWLRTNDATFYDVKGAADRCLDFLGAEGFTWRDTGSNPFFETHCELVGIEARTAGIGQTAPSILKKMDIAKDVYFFQCSIDKILGSKKSSALRVKPVPKFPLVRRDVAFVIDETVTVASLEEAMKNAAGTALAEVRLFDQFSGKNIPPGKRSLAFSLAYRKDDGTFTDEEIKALQDRVGEALNTKYGVEFR